MADPAGVAAAAKALSAIGESGGDPCGPFLQVSDLPRGAVSTLGEPFGSETIFASDDLAAGFDEIQIDLGEGPSWQTLVSRRPVLEPDLMHSTSDEWPLAKAALQEAGLGAVYAFPLVVAGINVGAIDLYSPSPSALTDLQIRNLTLLSKILARQVFHGAVLAAERLSEDAGKANSQYSRREVHQATGMVLAQMRISAQDALLVLRGHAFANGRSVREVAADVINRTLDFSTTD